MSHGKTINEFVQLLSLRHGRPIKELGDLLDRIRYQWSRSCPNPKIGTMLDPGETIWPPHRTEHAMVKRMVTRRVLV